MKRIISLAAGLFCLGVLVPSLSPAWPQIALQSTIQVPKTAEGKNAARPKTDLQKLQGIWWLEFTLGQKNIVLEQMALAIDGSRGSLIMKEGELEGGVYVDGQSTPKSLDFATLPFTRECIYLLEGDVLMLSYDGGSEAPRPSNFQIPKNGRRATQQVVLVFRRIVPSEVFPMRRADGSRFLPKMDTVVQLKKAVDEAE